MLITKKVAYLKPKNIMKGFLKVKKHDNSFFPSAKCAGICYNIINKIKTKAHILQKYLK